MAIEVGAERDLRVVDVDAAEPLRARPWRAARRPPRPSWTPAVRISKPAASRWQQSRQAPRRSPAAGRVDQLGELVEVSAERPLGAGCVLEQQRAAARSAASASRITLPARFTEGAYGSPFRAPAWSTTPCAPIPSPTASACSSEASDLRRMSGVPCRAVDQVHGVDHDRLDPGALDRLAERPRSPRSRRRSVATSAGSGGRSGSRRIRARRRARRLVQAARRGHMCAD